MGQPAVWEYFKVGVTIAGIMIPLLFGFGRVLLSQFEHRMSERFDAQDKLRDARMKAIEERQEREGRMLTALVEKVERLSVDLPQRFVQRDEHIRIQTIIDGKLDRLNEKQDTYLGRMNEKIDALKESYRGRN